MRLNYRETAEMISQVLIKAPNGANVPLSQLATVEEIVGPRQITRENSQRFITIQANVVGRDIGSFVVDGREAIEGQCEHASRIYCDLGRAVSTTATGK